MFPKEVEITVKAKVYSDKEASELRQGLQDFANHVHPNNVKYFGELASSGRIDKNMGKIKNMVRMAGLG